MELGHPLVPVFCYGQTNAYKWWKVPGRLVQNLTRFIKINPIIFWGILGSPIPLKNPLYVVVGRPIHVNKNPNPTTEEGVYYYFYQIFRNRAEAAALEKKMLGNGDGSVGMFSSLIVAPLSGCVNVLLTNPIWLVVTRMQTHKKESKRTIPDPRLSDATEQKLLFTVEHHAYGTSHVIQEVYDESGVLGFWKGVLPTLVMVSNPSIQFMLYETLLAKLKKRSASNTVSALQIFLLGAIAKLGATVVTYPLLVVKQERLQARQVKNGDKRHHYKGTRDAIFKMIRYEGFNGFYKGMGTKIVQSVLAAAVLFMVKE